MTSKGSRILMLIMAGVILTPATFVVYRATAQEQHREREVLHRDRLEAHLAELREVMERHEQELEELHELEEHADDDRAHNEIVARRRQVERELQNIRVRHEDIIHELEDREFEARRRHEDEPHDHEHDNHEHHGPEHHGPEAHVEHMMDRVHALHEAAERVAQTGMEDIARELHHRAEELEKQLHHQHHDGGNHELHEVIHHLVESNHQLREEVRELHHRLDHVVELLEVLHHSESDEDRVYYDDDDDFEPTPELDRTEDESDDFELPAPDAEEDVEDRPFEKTEAVDIPEIRADFPEVEEGEAIDSSEDFFEE